MTHKKDLEELLYCIAGYIHDYNDRNYGDADQWLRHVRNKWEDFIEHHPDSDDPLGYIRKLNKEQQNER